MLEFLTRVAGYLEELTGENRKLLAALKEFQQLLVAGKPDAIEQATPLIDRLTGKIRVLDETRRAYVDDHFRKHGWHGVRTFTAIAEFVKSAGVSDEEAAAFERLRKARLGLIEVLAEVDAQNSLNITLINQGMTFAEVSLRALLGCEDKPNTYGPSQPGEGGPSILDARA